MNFTELAKELWTLGAKIHVAEMVVVTGDTIFRGRGSIYVERESAILKVTVSGDQPLPKLGSGSFDANEFWLIAGIVAEQVAFWMKSLPRTHESGEGKTRRLFTSEFFVERLHEITGEVDAESLLDAAVEAEAASCAQWKFNSAEARLKGFEVVGFNECTEREFKNPYLGNIGSGWSRDTHLGEFEKLEYALIRDGSDCRVLMRHKKDVEPEAGDLQKHFQLLLKAVAFAHGQHAWPIFKEFTGERKLVWATPARQTTKTSFPAVSSRAYDLDDALSTVLGAYLLTMLREDEFAVALGEQVHLAREAAGKNVPFHTGMLKLCAVMEATALLVAEKLVPIDQASQQAFEEAKAKAMEQIRLLEEAASDVQKSAFKRLTGALRPIKYNHPKVAFQALLNHLQIPEKFGKPALDAWNVERHRRAHGKPPAMSKMSMIHKSRIGGMLNAFLLAGMGYKGTVLLSPFENAYFELK